MGSHRKPTKPQWKMKIKKACNGNGTGKFKSHGFSVAWLSSLSNPDGGMCKMICGWVSSVNLTEMPKMEKDLYQHEPGKFSKRFKATHRFSIASGKIILVSSMLAGFSVLFTSPPTKVAFADDGAMCSSRSLSGNASVSRALLTLACMYVPDMLVVHSLLSRKALYPLLRLGYSGIWFIRCQYLIVLKFKDLIMKNDDSEVMGVEGASIDIDLEEKRTSLCSTKVLQPRFTSGLGTWIHREISEGVCFIDRIEGDEGVRVLWSLTGGCPIPDFLLSIGPYFCLPTARIVSKGVGVIFIELTFGVI
ncbi:hypothetical protein V6N11_065285 [Hibiscus sabdariffa]|uniref:Uncharacterized protein n=2 Tax=Hibiscus sabdariffa TaxID=183260 RepID=A0ABR2QGJ9_9ROSI